MLASEQHTPSNHHHHYNHANSSSNDNVTPVDIPHATAAASNLFSSQSSSAAHSPERRHSPQLSRSPSISSPLNPHTHQHQQYSPMVIDGSASPSADGLAGISSGSPPPSPRIQRRPSNLSNLLSHTATAAEARAVINREDTVDIEGLLGPDERLRFFRCLDNDLLPGLTSPAERIKIVKVMETLLLLLENALNKGLGDGGDSKYLQVKLSNSAIRSKLDLDSRASKEGKGAPSLDYLHLCGWRYKVQDFQEYIHFPSDPTSKHLAELRTGTEILRVRLEKEHELAARVSERKQSAKQEEESRVKNALKQIKEDRERVKEVKERERLAREAAAAKGAATSPTSPGAAGPTSPRQEFATPKSPPVASSVSQQEDSKME